MPGRGWEVDRLARRIAWESGKTGVGGWEHEARSWRGLREACISFRGPRPLSPLTQKVAWFVGRRA